MLSIPFCVFCFLLLLRRKINLIEETLTTQVREHSDVFLANFTQKRDPLIDFIQLKAPPYLLKENELQERKIQESLLGG